MTQTPDTTTETERVDCPACFGIEEDEICDACCGRGYFLKRSSLGAAAAALALVDPPTEGVNDE